MDSRALEDCYYYLRGSCTNKSCTYRHSPTSKSSEIYCQGWQQFRCYNMNCPERHCAVPTHKKSSTTHKWNSVPPHASNANNRIPSTMSKHQTDAIVPALDGSTVSIGVNASVKIGKAQAICKYNLHGKCRNGSACTFLHSSPDVTQDIEPPSLQFLSDDLTMPFSSSSEPLSSSELPVTSTTATSTEDDGKRKGRDILDKYSFRKTLKIDEVKK